MDLRPCGTKAAYNRHLIAGERCGVCSAAARAGRRTAACSRCGEPVIRSKSSRLEILCHQCRREGAYQEDRACAWPACSVVFKALPASRKRYCSRRCAGLGTAHAHGWEEDPAGPRPRRSSAFRGYGPEHVAIRENWRLAVEAGHADCCEPVCGMASRWIEPGTAWDLSHDRASGGWLGPSHAACNRAEAARWRNSRAAGDRPPFPRGFLIEHGYWSPRAA